MKMRRRAEDIQLIAYNELTFAEDLGNALKAEKISPESAKRLMDGVNAVFNAFEIPGRFQFCVDQNKVKFIWSIQINKKERKQILIVSESVINSIGWWFDFGWFSCDIYHSIDDLQSNTTLLRQIQFFVGEIWHVQIKEYEHRLLVNISELN